MFKATSRKHLNTAQLLLCLCLLVQGCATLRPEMALPKEAATCQSWFENLDATVAEHGLQDPGSVRIAGHPQLRADRFWASMRDYAGVSREAFSDWLEQLRQLDASARAFEFANLPVPVAQQVLSGLPRGEDFTHAVQRCGLRLNALELSSPERQQHLLRHTEVPDAYQTWQRFFGIYALTRYADEAGLKRLHNEQRASFAQTLAQLPVQGQLLRYTPPAAGETKLSAEDLGKMMQHAYDNPLAVPKLTDAQLQALFERFAPVFEIDTVNMNDKIGTVTLDSLGQVSVDVKQPAVYAMHSYTRWHGKVLLQLIYQIWLPAREKTGIFDLYGGALDSVLWRVTLDSKGDPLAYDSIHACGCYYLLFPAQGYRALAPKDDAEPVLSPRYIPRLEPAQRLLLRLQSRTHYLQQVMPVTSVQTHEARRYGWQDAAQLRSLPLPDGSRRSLFDADGIVPASTRAERFLLWPFGVASPGAMRQWGTHAIAFTGKRHFDDAFLLDQLIDGL